MNDSTPATSADEALSNLMGAALNVPAPLIQPAPRPTRQRWLLDASGTP